MCLRGWFHPRPPLKKWLLLTSIAFVFSQNLNNVCFWANESLKIRLKFQLLIQLFTGWQEDRKSVRWVNDTLEVINLVLVHAIERSLLRSSKQHSRISEKRSHHSWAVSIYMAVLKSKLMCSTWCVGSKCASIQSMFKKWVDCDVKSYIHNRMFYITFIVFIFGFTKINITSWCITNVFCYYILRKRQHWCTATWVERS